MIYVIWDNGSRQAGSSTDGGAKNSNQWRVSERERMKNEECVRLNGLKCSLILLLLYISNFISHFSLHFSLARSPFPLLPKISIFISRDFFLPPPLLAADVIICWKVKYCAKHSLEWESGRLESDYWCSLCLCQWNWSSAGISSWFPAIISILSIVF